MTRIRHGMTGQTTRNFDTTVTIGQVLEDRGILREIGAPEGCRAVANGVTLQSTDRVADYDEIFLESQAANKAA